AYMTCAFLGGSAGSWLGVRAYDHLGWTGVTGLVALAAGLALVRHLLHRGSAAVVQAARPAGSDEAEVAPAVR
ncbi:MAG: hypothetical protein QOF44_3616, partial [Streptomyces sp.]|nr:hypothetical protein [Streptomyces sp.]